MALRIGIDLADGGCAGAARRESTFGAAGPGVVVRTGAEGGT